MVMSTLTHNTCANICYPPSHTGREGDKWRRHHFSIGSHSDFVFFISISLTLKERQGGEKNPLFPVVAFFELMKPTRMVREHGNPLLSSSRMEVNGGAQLPVHTCSDLVVVQSKA